MPTTTFVRDKLGRITKKVTQAGTVYYAYDASDKKISVKDTDLDETTYSYDANGRMTEVTVDGVRKTYFVYDGSGKVTKKILHNNLVMSYFEYDAAGRLQVLRNLDSSLGEITYFAYTRNENGGITQIDREIPPHESYRAFFAMGYDALDRLTSEREWQWGMFAPIPGDGKEYAYDAASNRTWLHTVPADEHTYFAHDERNLVTTEWNMSAAETRYYDYDGAQRMVSNKTTSAQSSYFTYDQRDQVTQIDFADATSADSTREFVYNGLGERVYVKDGTGAYNQTYWTFDGAKLIRASSTTESTRPWAVARRRLVLTTEPARPKG